MIYERHQTAIHKDSQAKTPPHQRSSLPLSLPLAALPSPIANQIAGGPADIDMSPAPAVTSLDEMDDKHSVVIPSTDSASHRDAHDPESDHDSDLHSSNHTSSNNSHHNARTNINNTKLLLPDRHLTIEFENSLSIPTHNATAHTEDAIHSPRPLCDPKAGFAIGFAEDRNRRHRRTMEDAHAFISNFLDVQGQGYFAVFDGHAGKSAAEWCGQHLHETLEISLQKNTHKPTPEVLNECFVSTDKQLAERPGMHSGCTVAVALLRVEDTDPNDASIPDASSTLKANGGQHMGKRRVLYTANAGDARIVLCRNGVAERLSYDHKGSDVPEQVRISQSGGFVLNNRVNGVLAVTRSLGDCAMKEWVIGNPYTAETPICETDDFFIVACDGLWDVCTDQTAVDLVANIQDPQKASEQLLAYALEQWSTDNLSVMVVRLDPNWKYDGNTCAKAIVTTSGSSSRD
ncbi:hypothetical protein SeLEV6574_g07425 [Synchytrium endobioticum]|nr:hypothetical protein SeLEV6574_g07425 [Synchytrium endobioticum]